MRKIKPEKIPQELKALPQWAVWKWEERDGKPTKPLYDSKTGNKASHSDPSTWGPFENAVNGLERGFDGTGFVFSEKDPFCGIDLDECRDPVSGEVAPWAARIVKDFDSYTEVSPSKPGLKIFIKGRLSGGGIKTKYVEVYDKTRYFTGIAGNGNHKRCYEFRANRPSYPGVVFVFSIPGRFIKAVFSLPFVPTLCPGNGTVDALRPLR
jgi:primase-polymerase (primpol)-like protein